MDLLSVLDTRRETISGRLKEETAIPDKEKETL